MSKKSHPGDGDYGKGEKGLLSGAPRRGLISFGRGLLRGLVALRRR